MTKFRMFLFLLGLLGFYYFIHVTFFDKINSAKYILSKQEIRANFKSTGFPIDLLLIDNPDALAKAQTHIQKSLYAGYPKYAAIHRATRHMGSLYTRHYIAKSDTDVIVDFLDLTERTYYHFIKKGRFRDCYHWKSGEGNPRDTEKQLSPELIQEHKDISRRAIISGTKTNAPIPSINTTLIVKTLAYHVEENNPKGSVNFNLIGKKAAVHLVKEKKISCNTSYQLYKEINYLPVEKRVNLARVLLGKRKKISPTLDTDK